MKSVTYWYQFFTAREELVKFTKCEICGSIELPVPFLPPLVWRGQCANPRPIAPEADALTTRLSGPVDQFKLARIMTLTLKQSCYHVPESSKNFLSFLSKLI